MAVRSAGARAIIYWAISVKTCRDLGVNIGTASSFAAAIPNLRI